ncbi:MAG TPA: hypothetical protein VH165_22340 [Kofleriaceae bacterium]|nr:hypothetical protein [Kofleriaceae bacterium]
MKAMGSARLVVLSILGATAGATSTGCSLLYNVSNLPDPRVDAGGIPPPPDAILDPDALMLTAASPTLLYEGQGSGGSRAAILVINGSNIAPDAQVSLAATDPAAAAPMVTIDNAHAMHTADNTMIAVPVTLLVDPTNTPGGKAVDLPLTIQITQSGSTGMVTSPALTGQVSLHCLPELTAPLAAGVAPEPLYSQIAPIPANLSFAALAGAAIELRSVSSIDVGNVVSNTAGATPGPGGGAGGGPGLAGTGPGGGQPGALLGLLTGGGGAGFFAGGGAGGGGTLGGAMSGDPLIVSYATTYASGGGGGGSAITGGGGGGTVELTAGGTLTVGTVTVDGGNGANGSTLIGGGGGGAGGVVVIRAGAGATLGAISAKGGTGGTSGLGGAGGIGSIGRVRVDAPSIAGTQPGFSSSVRRGVAFATAAPLVTHDPHVLINVVSAFAADQFQVVVRDAANTTIQTSSLLFATPTAAITPSLSPGFNRVCVLPPGGTLTNEESTNCLDLVYVP